MSEYFGSEFLDGVREWVRKYPIAMPARGAWYILGMDRNTFYARVRQGCIRYSHDGPTARKRYLTEELLAMRGITIRELVGEEGSGDE